MHLSLQAIYMPYLKKFKLAVFLQFFGMLALHTFKMVGRIGKIN
jgi:hypothetical protein